MDGGLPSFPAPTGSGKTVLFEVALLRMFAAAMATGPKAMTTGPKARVPRLTFSWDSERGSFC